MVLSGIVARVEQPVTENEMCAIKSIQFKIFMLIC